MLTSDDLTQMSTEGLELIGDNETAVTIRRGNTTLVPQSVRLLRRKTGVVSRTPQGTETRTGVLIMGAVDLDIQINDRFTTGGALYRVSYVQPDKRAATFAEAILEV